MSKVSIGLGRASPVTLGVAAVAGLAGLGLLWRRLGRPPKVRAQTRRFQKAVIVNAPLTAVEAFLRGTNTLGLRLQPGPGPREFKAEAKGLRWTLSLSDEAGGKRTRISAAAPAAGSRVRGAALELRDIKALIETGEIATVAGQPHGRRSLFGQAAEAVSETLRSVTERRISPAAKARSQEVRA